MKLAGLDIGTTGCKLTVFDEAGVPCGRAYRDYPVTRGLGGHELSALFLMDSVFAVIREMAEKFPDIGGIGVTSFGETFLLTDKNGTPLHNAILYTDPRGKEERQALTELLGEKEIIRTTGLRPHEMYSLPKLMWIRRNCPEVYEKAAYAFLIEDYVVYHLTGVRQIDYSLATRTMAFDLNTLRWSDAMFDAAGIDSGLFGVPVPTGTSAGTVLPSVREKTGLSPTCQIVSVSHDQVSAAVGAGAFDGSTGVDGAGTVQCLTPIFDTMPDPEILSESYLSLVPYAVPGKFVAYAFSYTGGALLQWYTDTFCKAEKAQAKEAGISVNQLLEAQYGKDSPTGLLVLPHLAGAATPYMDTGSRAAFIGLTGDTNAAALYRGCMEGVCYEMRINYEAVLRTGVSPKKLHATGGGARSRVWMQMKADVLDLPITALKTADAGTVGSAMLTGLAVGVFSSLQNAAELMVQEAETYLPREEAHTQYMEIFDRYRRVYPAVRPLI